MTLLATATVIDVLFCNISDDRSCVRLKIGLGELQFSYIVVQLRVKRRKEAKEKGLKKSVVEKKSHFLFLLSTALGAVWDNPYC